MNIVVLYHPNSDHARTVEDYARDFSRQTGDKIELISLETTAGADKARMYDIVRYPAVMAISDSGELMKAWQGPVLPLMNELSFYSTNR